MSRPRAEPRGNENKLSPVCRGLGRATFLGVVGGAMIGAVLFWAPSRAHAFSCGGGAYNTEATVSQTATHRGVRVNGPGMTVYDNNPSCTQISSIAVLNSSGDLTEIGWSEDGTRSQSCYTNSPLNTPYVFQVSVRNGNYACLYDLINLSGGDVIVVNTSDMNADDNWTFVENGHSLNTYTESFSAGIVVSNAERHSSTGPANADFNGMQYADSTGWHDWTAAVCGPVGNDPSYNNQLVTVKHVTVTTHAADCTPP